MSIHILEILRPTMAASSGARLQRKAARTAVSAATIHSFRRCYGSEFISRDLDLWAYHKGVVLDFSRPGKPTDNSYIESFNGKFRAECLNAHWFMSLDDARTKMEDWRRDYNEFRPHSAIGNKVPISLMNGSSAGARRTEP
ncbi:transposase InsO family protein [Rhizobium mongolense]